MLNPHKIISGQFELNIMKYKTNSFSNIIRTPIVKIIIGGLICILLPVLINKLLLDNLFKMLEFNDNLNISVRVCITMFILMPLFYIILFRSLEKRRISELDITNVKSIILSFILSILIIGISFILLNIIGLITISDVQVPELIILNVIVVISFVLIEEFFFRAIFYRIIESSWGTKIALVLSALIFALLHLSNENTSILSFLSVISGGLVLGILYTYTKNLFVPIAFHFGWNLSQVLLGFGLSGGDEFNKLYVFNLNVKGNTILTGGESGVENSVLIVIILLALFAILYKMSQQENKIIYRQQRVKLSKKE